MVDKLPEVVGPLTVVANRDVDGIEMGVLSDGTPFLSMRSLSKLCGIANSTLSETSKAWLGGKRDSKLAQFLVQAGLAVDSLYIQTSITGVAGNLVYAYPDYVCALVLEYYGLEQENLVARQNYRLINRAGIRIFIYTQLGYDPSNRVPTIWRQFHDRQLLVTAPTGFFSVFQETAAFVLHALRAGLSVDERTVPDISIGRTWSDYWLKNQLAGQFGERQRFEHNYPDYFPQAASNPQPAWVYPFAALPAFRLWLQTDYAREKFPNYLSTKVSQGILPPSARELLLVEVGAQLPGGPTTQPRQLGSG